MSSWIARCRAPHVPTSAPVRGADQVDRYAPGASEQERGAEPQSYAEQGTNVCPPIWYGDPAVHDEMTERGCIIQGRRHLTRPRVRQKTARCEGCEQAHRTPTNPDLDLVAASRA